MILDRYCRVLPVFCCIFLQAAVQARRLNSFVRHFEPLSYEPRRVHRDHVRFKRSLGQSQQQQHHHQQQQQQPGHVYVRFQGFDRLFHLKLKPDTSVFHKDLVVETTRFGRVKPDIGHIYSGKLIGEPSSRVFGALHDGVFEGSIQSRGDRFYVEAAHKFFARPTPFHSVMYAAGDVQMPGGPNGWCGVRGEAARWMQQLVAAIKRPDPPPRAPRTRRRGARLERWIGRRPLAQEGDAEQDYYNGEEEEESHGVDGTDREGRRRQGGRRRRTYRVCGLFIAIDHLLYAKFSERDNDAVRTRERLATLIAGHVARASEVYRRTNFGGIEDVSFNVHKIKINDTKSCSAGSNPFCEANMDPTLFLLMTAKSANFDEYCLAYTWTYRDFDDGVLGLAYVGNASASMLGVCDKNRLAPEDPSKPQHGLSRLSFNTGMITFINYGQYVSQAASEITLCHEIGHNFGSPHDQPDSSPCVPGKKKGGNYIMYPQASQGTEPNNRDFSNCSIGNITEVIKPMVNGQSSRENCFEEESKPICGNELVEGREACDCGYTEADCKEKCCYARHNAVRAEGCTLQPGKQCSPSSGPCCDKNCKLMPSSTVCHPATECREAALCINQNATCPHGKPKANLTSCNKGSQVCLNGECEGSACLKYNMNECTLTGPEYNLDQKCLIACESEGHCKPACHYPALKSLCGAKMQPGAMCDGTRGYCDVFHKCRRSDEQGPLTRLEQALFGGKTIKSVEDYIWAHPFLSAIYLLVFVALMALFFRCFSLHTPSNNPHKPHRKFRETLRNPKSFFLPRA